MKRDSETDLEFFYRLKAQHEAEERERLTRAKEEARQSGKEEFDFLRFKSMYRYLDSYSEKELEYHYFVVNPTLTKLEEFVRAMELREVYDGGDMHLD